MTDDSERTSKNPLINFNINLGDAPEYAHKICATLAKHGVWLVEPLRERWAARAEVVKANSDAEVARIKREMSIEKRLAKIKGDREVASFEDRVRLRNETVEAQRLLNIENITCGAAEILQERVSDEPVDRDWVEQFLNGCQDVSNELMQSLWSRILSGEVASPGSFSPRTLQVVKTLQTEDANAFTAYCEFVWGSNDDDANASFFIELGEHIQPWMSLAPAATEMRRLYCARGVTDMLRLHLQSLNLIYFAQGTRQLCISPVDGCVQLIYHGKHHRLRHDDPTRTLDFEADILTDIGRELAPISGAKRNPEFEELVLKFIPGGFSVES